MKRSTVLVVLTAVLLLSGCVASHPDVYAAPHAWLVPKSFEGVPIQRIAWTANLPYLDAVPWRTVAPKTFTVSPAAAIRKAAQYGEIGWRLSSLVYIQPAGLVGGHTGSPPSVYLVEFVGANLGSNIAGPDLPNPPTVQFSVFSVNGHTGGISPLTEGEVHGVVRGGRVLHLWPEPAAARRVVEIPSGKFPHLIGLGAVSLAGADSVWQDGSVAEYGEVWNPLYVYAMRQGTTTYFGTQLNFATAFPLISEYDRQYACPWKIGKLHIVGIKGSTVAFQSGSGRTGSFNRSTHHWSFTSPTH